MRTSTSGCSDMGDDRLSLNRNRLMRTAVGSAASRQQLLRLATPGSARTRSSTRSKKLICCSGVANLVPRHRDAHGLRHFAPRSRDRRNGDCPGVRIISPAATSRTSDKATSHTTSALRVVEPPEAESVRPSLASATSPTFCRERRIAGSRPAENSGEQRDQQRERQHPKSSPTFTDFGNWSARYAT